MTTTPSPRRVRVTGPPVRRRPRPSVAAELDEQTRLGELYLRSLMRSQLRLALGLSLLLVVTVGLIPLAFVLVPVLGGAHVFGVPLAWLLLGGGCYPVLLALALAYVRRAERNERDFHDLVGPSGEQPVSGR